MGMPCVTRVAHGFLLNGIVRGGGYQTTDISRLRCGMRYETGIRGAYVYRGFRCEWCVA